MILEKLKQALASLFLTFPALTLSLDETRVLWLLSIIIILDSFVALAAAFKQKRVASWKMGQPFAKKVALYGAALSAVYVLAQSEHAMFGWMFEWTVIYLIISESLSIFENLAIFGFKTPSHILSTINWQMSVMQKGRK